MSVEYDAIVIGAGHNGLVTAAYLARAGLKVLILERRDVLGGAAATEEVFPGFHFNTGADEAGLLVPEIIDDLHLRRRGLEFVDSPVAFTALNPGGKALVIPRDLDAAQGEISRTSAPDARRFREFVQIVSRYSSLIQEMMKITPPDLGNGLKAGEALPWLNPVLRLRRLGGDEMMSLLRLLPMSVGDFLGEWFDGPILKGAFASLAVRGSFQGPMAAGTAFQLLYHFRSSGLDGSAASRFVRGGTGGLAVALARAALEGRAEIRTGQGVKRILVRDGRAAGVRLDTGEEILSRLVVSSADPRRTYLDLVGGEELPLNVVRRVKNIRFQGSVSKVNLALSGLPAFEGVFGLEGLRSRVVLSPGVEHLERAYDEAKYGRISPNPSLEFVIPTLLDPTLAPAGRQILSICVRYTPYHLKDGSWDERREELGDLVVQTLAAVAPDLPELIIDRQILTPLDLEREVGLTEGSEYHGQMGLDQLLFMRPIPGYGQYRSPIRLLYLCGAGTHPGGGVTGAPGYNAAREIFADWRG